MESLLDWGIQVVLWFQQFSPTLDLPFKAFTFLGVFVLIGLWLGLRIAFHQLEPADVYRVYRYALVGLWGGLGAPWLFVRLRLAEKKP